MSGNRRTASRAGRPKLPYLVHHEASLSILKKELKLTSERSISQNSEGVDLRDFQSLIKEMYFEKDQARGIEGTFMWLMEEVGELATALRDGSQEERLGEFADVLAWLATIANLAEIDLSEAVARKYGQGCPGCSC